MGEVADHLTQRISPGLWKLAWRLMQQPQDGYMPEGAARAYLGTCRTRHCLCSMVGIGRWRPNFEEMVALARDFLGKAHG